jgi:hypothetical protein
MTMGRHNGASSKRKHQRRRKQNSRRANEQAQWRQRSREEARDGLHESDPAEKWQRDPRHYLDRDGAPWKQLPATPGQVRKLRSLNALPAAFPTRGEASAEITRILEARGAAKRAA